MRFASHEEAVGLLADFADDEEGGSAVLRKWC